MQKKDIVQKEHLHKSLDFDTCNEFFSKFSRIYRFLHICVFIIQCLR